MGLPGLRDELEFVYPKLEAAKISRESGESVLAADPESDKLPVNLSADDTKVVTLWLLSPKRVTADHRGEGLTAEKYESGNDSAVPAPRSTEGPKPAVSSEMPMAAKNRPRVKASASRAFAENSEQHVFSGGLGAAGAVGGGRIASEAHAKAARVPRYWKRRMRSPFSIRC